MLSKGVEGRVVNKSTLKDALGQYHPPTVLLSYCYMAEGVLCKHLWLNTECSLIELLYFFRLLLPSPFTSINYYFHESFTDRALLSVTCFSCFSFLACCYFCVHYSKRQSLMFIWCRLFFIRLLGGLWCFIWYITRNLERTSGLNNIARTLMLIHRAWLLSEVHHYINVCTKTISLTDFFVCNNYSPFQYCVLFLHILLQILSCAYKAMFFYSLYIVYICQISSPIRSVLFLMCSFSVPSPNCNDSFHFIVELWSYDFWSFSSCFCSLEELQTNMVYILQNARKTF